MLYMHALYSDSQVGMDAGLFHSCFFAFLVIYISVFNVFNYYFYTSFFSSLILWTLTVFLMCAWLNFYDCLFTIFSQHIIISTSVSLAENKSFEHQ